MTAKSKNKAPKLLSCPFCGGKGDIIKSGTARSARKYHVCCDNERCMLFVGGRWYDTAEEAAEKWNARAYAAGDALLKMSDKGLAEFVDSIDRKAVLKALNEIGGCGADADSWADGWDKAVDEAIRIVECIPSIGGIEGGKPQ